MINFKSNNVDFEIYISGDLKSDKEVLGLYTIENGCDFNIDPMWCEVTTFNDSANRIRAYKIYGDEDDYMNVYDVDFKKSFNSLIKKEINKNGIFSDKYIIFK